MTFPEYVPTRQVTVGGAMGLESSRLLMIRVTTAASKSLIWDESGYRFVKWSLVEQSGLGTEVSMLLPRTDVAGWKDGLSGALIDVSAENSYTHQYTTLVEFLDDSGRPVGISPITLGPYVVPDGDGPIDLDKTVPASTVAGGLINVPDSWGTLVAAAQAAAAEAAANLAEGSEVFASLAQGEKADAALPAAQKGAASGVAPLDDGSRVPQVNLPAHLTPTALEGTFVGHASGWTDAEMKRHAEQSSRGRSEVNVLIFGADPTGATDSTDAINDAITAANTFKIGTVYIPAGRYRVDGTIAITSSVSLVGQYTGYAPSSGDRVSGTVLVAGTNVAGDPVIEVKNPTVGGYLSGMALRDLFILGSNSWTSGTGAKDRVGVRLFKVISEYKIDGVHITGFLRQGLHLREVWDGTMTNCRIMYCGTSGLYPGLDVTNTPEGNTNSLHAYGLHIEHCPYILNIAGDSRHNIFDGCKFELNSVAPTSSPITIGTSLENTFVGCYFVSRNADDPLYASSTTQPCFINVNSSKAHVTFSDCMGTVAGYTGTPLVDAGSGTTDTFYGGARWLNVQAGVVQWRGGIVNAWCGGGTTPFVLADRCMVNDTTIRTGAKGGVRTLFTLANECIVSGNTITAIDSARSVTSGALFTCSGARNIIGPNVIRDNVFTFMSTSLQQTLTRSSGDEFTITSGATPNLGWVDRFATDRFVIAMGSATNVTGFTNGWIGREVLLRFTTANATLVHSANLVLKGAVDVTPASGSIMRFIALSATSWAEVSRNF